MPAENDNLREIVEEILIRFQPIDHLFNVMGAADSGVQGVFVRRWAEIGMYLADNFRECLNEVIADHKKQL